MQGPPLLPCTMSPFVALTSIDPVASTAPHAARPPHPGYNPPTHAPTAVHRPHHICPPRSSSHSRFFHPRARLDRPNAYHPYPLTMDGFLQKATQFAEQQFENSESGSANRIASHRIAHVQLVFSSSLAPSSSTRVPLERGFATLSSGHLWSRVAGPTNDRATQTSTIEPSSRPITASMPSTPKISSC